MYVLNDMGLNTWGPCSTQSVPTSYFETWVREGRSELVVALRKRLLLGKVPHEAACLGAIAMPGTIHWGATPLTI